MIMWPPPRPKKIILIKKRKLYDASGRCCCVFVPLEGHIKLSLLKCHFTSLLIYHLASFVQFLCLLYLKSLVSFMTHSWCLSGRKENPQLNKLGFAVPWKRQPVYLFAWHFMQKNLSLTMKLFKIVLTVFSSVSISSIHSSNICYWYN